LLLEKETLDTINSQEIIPEHLKNIKL